MSRGSRNRNRSRKKKALLADKDVAVLAAPQPQEKFPSFDKNEPHVPTAFLWQMLHRERIATAPHADLVNVAATLIHAAYPGIEYWPSQTDVILNDLIRPELEKDFADTLVQFKSEAEALSSCGARTNVRMLRHCEGSEWETWHAEQRAMMEARALDREYAAFARQWDLVA